MDCIDKCRQGAIRYTRRKNKQGGNTDRPTGRRQARSSQILYRIGITCHFSRTESPGKSTTPRTRKSTADWPSSKIKKKPDRTTPITPPGSLSADNFSQHCTACQLCVSVLYEPCAASFGEPSNIYAARSIVRARILSSRMRQMFGSLPDRSDPSDHESGQDGYPEIGHAVLIQENCIVNRDGVTCGNCARHCPTQAILMVAKDPNDPDSPQLPVVNEEKCIGCGPVKPVPVASVQRHLCGRARTTPEYLIKK